MKKTMNIAIDGPAGAGKSTIAKALSRDLGYIYVDTGAMYRAIALFFLRKGTSADDAEAIEEALGGIDIALSYEDGAQHVFLNKEDVSKEIRREEVGNMASKVSAIRCVREKLLSLQRNIASENDVVMDGRDIGSFVLPDAKVKVYLSAGVDVRARRRYDELVSKGEKADLAQIEEDIKNRDFMDMNREIAPLVKAEDAYFLDSSNLSIEEVLEKMKEYICEKALP